MDLDTKCSKCGKALDLEDMRALPENKGFVCKACFEGGGLKPRGPIPSNIAEKSTEKEFFDKRKYVCEKCKYCFLRSATTTVEKCPFCGSPDVHEKIEQSANKLLKKDGLL